MQKYILNRKNEPVPEPDLMKWAKWIENSRNRIVKQEKIIGHYFVSTVFLGIDHAFCDSPRPVLFETMLFDCNGLSIESNRTYTYKLALEMHDEFVKKFEEAARTAMRLEEIIASPEVQAEINRPMVEE